MKPIDIDELFKIKAFTNELDSTLIVNDQTGKPIVTENVPEEASTNHESLDKEEEASANTDDLPNRRTSCCREFTGRIINK